MHILMHIAPAAEGHGLCPWMNAPAFGRMSPHLGVKKGAMGYACGAPQIEGVDDGF